jgi:hypothetical protein
MLTAEEMEPAGHVHVNTGRLWGGGIATAIVAALAVLAGVFITRGVLGIPVLAPKAASAFGDSSASGTPARDRPPGRCAVPSVHPRAGPGCATRSRPGRAPAVAMIAARHRRPSAPT